MTSPDLLSRLNRMDLNLLTVLHALLETGSTKAAADKLGRTQSAASHSLGRLRELFGDPLFTRHGPKLTPTPLALQIEQPLRRILNEAASVISSGILFDPETSDRRITIAAADICLSSSLKVVNALSQAGPNLQVSLTSPRKGQTRLANGEVDILLSLYRADFAAGLKTTPLKSVEWCCYCRDGLPVSDTPTAQEWASYGHIQVSTGPDSRNPIHDAARLAGVDRTVRLKVSSFLEAINVVAETDLLFTTLGTLIEGQATRIGLRRIALPFAVPDVPMTLVTRAGTHEPMSKWLHDQAAQALTTGVP